MSSHAHQKGLDRLSIPALIATAIAGLIGLSVVGQDVLQGYAPAISAVGSVYCTTDGDGMMISDIATGRPVERTNSP